MKNSPYSFRKNIFSSEQGGVLILLAFALMVLLLAGAVAIDMSRYQTARAKFSSCVDNSALAGLHAANQAYSSNCTGNAAAFQAAALLAAQQYYTANCSSFGTASPFTSETASCPNSFQVTATATENATIMSLFGQKLPLTLNANSTAVISQNNSMEIVLVLDNTGSMALTPKSAAIASLAQNCPHYVDTSANYPSNKNSKMCALQEAAEEFIYTLAGSTIATNLPSSSWIGIVPFSQAVNIGGYTSGLTSITPAGAAINFATNFNVPINEIVTVPTVDTADFGPAPNPPNNVTGEPASINAVSTATCPGSGGTYAASGTAPKCTAPIKKKNGGTCPDAPGSNCYYSNGSHTFPAAFDFSNPTTSNWYGCVGQRTSKTTMTDYTGSQSLADENDNLPMASAGGATPGGTFPLYLAPASMDITGSKYSAYRETTGAAPGTYQMSAAEIGDIFPYGPSEYYTQLNVAYAALLSNNWTQAGTATNSTAYAVPEQAAIIPPVAGLYPQGPNAFCPSPITTMTNDIPTLLNALGNMYPAGQTILDSGMQWGGFMLSGFWGGNTPSANISSPTLGAGTQIWKGPVTMDTNGSHNMALDKLPLPYNQPGNLKVMIFMTDGYNFFFPGSYTAYSTLADGRLLSGGTGSPIFDESSAEGELNSRFLATCNTLQNEGVDIFVIALGDTDGVSSGAHKGTPPYDVNGALLQSCASSPSQYYLASTASALIIDFQQIAALLSRLRISNAQ